MIAWFVAILTWNTFIYWATNVKTQSIIRNFCEQHNHIHITIHKNRSSWSSVVDFFLFLCCLFVWLYCGCVESKCWIWVKFTGQAHYSTTTTNNYKSTTLRCAPWIFNWFWSVNSTVLYYCYCQCLSLWKYYY